MDATANQGSHPLGVYGFPSLDLVYCGADKTLQLTESWYRDLSCLV
jgi:hypothetical protein